MFTQFRICNYRTHLDTTLDLSGITLLIGGNNVGKTNFLDGISHFTGLIRRSANPETPLEHQHFYSHRHRLAAPEKPIGFSCEYKHETGEIKYDLVIKEDKKVMPNGIGSKERIQYRTKSSSGFKKLENGAKELCPTLGLRTAYEHMLSDGEEEVRSLIKNFYKELSQCFSYHFQPYLLKSHSDEQKSTTGNIAQKLGDQGEGLQEVLWQVLHSDTKILDQCVRFLREFEPSFHGVRKDENKNNNTLWQFSIGGPLQVEQFPAQSVSDGLLKAAAIGLLCSMRDPPGLILLEEFENGIGQRNLRHFLNLLYQAVGHQSSTPHGYRTQFIITSHSPTILREFPDRLENVAQITLSRKEHKSNILNLNDYIKTLIRGGSADAQIIMNDGHEQVDIDADELLRLWYKGIIGGEWSGIR